MGLSNFFVTLRFHELSLIHLHLAIQQGKKTGLRTRGHLFWVKADVLRQDKERWGGATVIVSTPEEAGRNRTEDGTGGPWRHRPNGGQTLGQGPGQQRVHPGKQHRPCSWCRWGYNTATGFLLQTWACNSQAKESLSREDRSLTVFSGLPIHLFYVKEL